MGERSARVLSTREVHSGRVFDLRVEEVELPGGRRTRLDLVRHPGAAVVVPLLDTGEVALVRQYRHAAGGEWLLEVPAGTLNPGERPEACAERECAEEAGFRPRTLVPLGFLWTTPGFTDEKIWVYLGRDLEPAAQRLDDDENLSVELLPLAEALHLALGGGIDDGKSIVALTRAAARLGVVAASGGAPPPPGR
jgi:ADP-ribose pyrophosphatase